MKRFVFPLLAVLALFTPLAAHAEWVTKEVRWRISSQGSPFDPSAIYIRDTLRTSIGPVDTTASFTLNEATVPLRGVSLYGLAQPLSTAAQDTCVVAWLVVQSDSTAAPTAPALTSITALIDGRLGGFGPVLTLGAGWVKADSALANGAAGGGMILADQTVAFPIRAVSPYGNIFRFGELRARITGVGGAVGIAAARVFLRYHRPDVKQENN